MKATAVRQAAAVRAEREAAFAARERQIRELVTGFFVAHGQVEQVLAAANERCRQIMAAATAAAEQAQSQAAGAVAGLQAMGLSRQELAQVTRLKAGQVRALLAAARTTDPPEHGATPDGEVPVAGNGQDAGSQPLPDGGGGPDPARARPGPAQGRGQAMEAPAGATQTAGPGELTSGQPGTRPAPGGDPHPGAVGGWRTGAEEAVRPR